MIVLIPARIGSKGVPLKNLRDLGGYPLLAWSIAAGRLLGYPTWLSSDSLDICDIAKKYGAKIIARSWEVSTDTSTDIEVVADFLEYKIIDNDEIIYLRPTTPFRNPVLLNQAVWLWSHHLVNHDSLCSGHSLTESADKLLKFRGCGMVTPYNDALKLEDIHNPRQFAKETIQTNGVIDIFKTDKVAGGVLWGNDMLGFITPKTIEIDDEIDLEWANFYLNKYGHPLLDYMKAVYGR